jgi:hypothetical protein
VGIDLFDRIWKEKRTFKNTVLKFNDAVRKSISEEETTTFC